jgi:hypothetical protein
MNRLKVLGLAFLAIFAISAISGTAAEATEFHSEIKETFIFGEQEGENVFTTTAGTIKCKVVTEDSLVAQVAEGGSGTNWTRESWAVQPQFKECKGFGQSAVVANPPAKTLQACDTIKNGKTKATTYTGTPLPAPGGNDTACEVKAEIAAGNCSVVVNQQTPTTPTLTFANTTFEGIGAVKVTSGVSGITYTVEGAKGSICGEPGVHTDGKISGNTILRGYKSGTHTKAEQVGIKWE